jgi:hypothetical protein
LSLGDHQCLCLAAALGDSSPPLADAGIGCGSLLPPGQASAAVRGLEPWSSLELPSQLEILQERGQEQREREIDREHTGAIESIGGSRRRG